MSRTLMVIGRHAVPDPMTEAVAAIVTAAPMVRCASPQELVTEVAKAALGGPLDRLDLFDHGREGRLRMGDPVLFDYPTGGGAVTGSDIAQLLKTYLTGDAQVRLLGCNTGAGEPGRQLLLQLGEIFGAQRVVYGGLEYLYTIGFDAHGFLDVLTCPYLYSSKEAVNGPAPASTDTRVKQCKARAQGEKTDRVEHFSARITALGACPVCGPPQGSGRAQRNPSA
ncbi:MAG: DUF4347 domain-containing protein [Myxococcaceae bacterium]